jgi:hypothetical protein
MTLDVDLHLLETWQRFQDFCFHIARAECRKAGGHAVKLGDSWDGGRDVVVLLDADKAGVRTVALQSKFTRSCGSATKQSILKSLNAMAALEASMLPHKYILCMPVNPTGPFLDWFRAEMMRRRMPYEVWGRAELLARLSERQDIFHTFFYRVFADLEKWLVADDLELRRLTLDAGCEWTQPDLKVLEFFSADKESPDLVLDLVVRNRGRMEACLFKIAATVNDWSPVPHGIPGQGLLLSKITYGVSLGGGRPGHRESTCEPPLLIRPLSNQRFKIRLTETGYSWSGAVQIELEYGEKRLPLPCLRLST